MGVTLKDIQGARVVGAECMTGTLAPCVRMWTGRQSPGVKVTSPAAAHTGEAGKAQGNQIRGRQKSRTLFGGRKPLFSDAPAPPASSLKAVPVGQSLPESN